MNDRNEHLKWVPDPMARAPRVIESGSMPLTALYSGKNLGCDAIVAVVSRDTSGVTLSDAQRLSHFPASPLICLSWYNTRGIGTIAGQKKGIAWRQFDENILFSGSQSTPTVSWSSGGVRGGMMYFTVSTAQQLFNIDVTAIQDRSVCARQLLGATWWDMLDQLEASKDDATMLDIIKHHVLPRWSSTHHTSNSVQGVRYAGRRWVDGLVAKAMLWQSSRSLRQVERRVKAISGRSLREWQVLVSTEKAFFEAAKDDPDTLNCLDWAALALDAGFADQAHLSRAVKRITGFPPAEFARRFVEDESLWIYRLWI